MRTPHPTARPPSARACSGMTFMPPSTRSTSPGCVVGVGAAGFLLGGGYSFLWAFSTPVSLSPYIVKAVKLARNKRQARQQLQHCLETINGGNFYDVARDMNVQNIQTPEHDESVLGVGSAQGEASGHRLMGIESGARMLPYDVSHRPHILSSSFTDARNPIRVDYPHLQPGVDLQLPQIDPLRGYESRDAHSRLVEPHPGLNNSSAIGYYPDWEPRSRGSEFNHPSLSATVSLVPNPQPSFPSQLNWSGDPLRRPRPTNIHPVSSTNSGQGPSTSGQLPRLPAAEPSRSLAQLHNSSFPWDRPLHEPKTSINGGTFISGNVNRYGETGKLQISVSRHGFPIMIYRSTYPLFRHCGRCISRLGRTIPTAPVSS
ncbi:hypothetical protein B0H11DRAFT_1354013 [Mycena galericulata]|nr:hypothetical protein B0H11DRAFT_1354013 [Mycena galericulata]